MRSAWTWRPRSHPRWRIAAIALIAALGLGGCAAGRPPTAALDAPSGPEGPADDANRPVPDAEEAALVAEALETSESARVLWEEGDIQAALDTLDVAYALLLQIPDEPDLIQQKEDLRHLISRRIVEIYGSRLATAADHGSPIPVEINEHVEREIERFTGRERRFFLESYQRSGRYRAMIVRKLREAGLPEELSWLPLVESGFKTRALSSARALGMWQFISSTGSRYGLARTQWVDQRMDPARSTDAAIQYLTDLHAMFGDWLTALAGYNCGEHRVMSVIRRQPNDYLDRFWDVYVALPSETARYVPRFLATLAIVRDPEKYGMELPEPLPPLDHETVAVSRHARLADLDRALGLEPETLAALNPELRHGTTPADPYPLKVPPAATTSFDAQLAALPDFVPVTHAFHRVRRGETLSTIASRHRTTVGAIVRANGLRSRHRIWVGQRLKIPQRGGTAPAVAAGTSTTPVRHTVRRGESLWKLASRYGTTVDRIKADNGLRGDGLAIGQRLVIRSGSAADVRRYTVRRGDTITRIARAQRVPVDALLRTNGLSRSSTIYPGQVLRIAR